MLTLKTSRTYGLKKKLKEIKYEIKGGFGGEGKKVIVVFLKYIITIIYHNNSFKQLMHAANVLFKLLGSASKFLY